MTLWYLGIVGLFIAVTDYVKDLFTNFLVLNTKKLGKQTGKVVVMTGGSSGIGFGILKKLLQLDYTIILGVQSKAEGERCIAKLHKLGIPSSRVKFHRLELKSLHSVRQFAMDVLASKESERIDLLVNNAGIMNVPYEKTVDNFESHFQVNYLSHFLLTNLLLPRMKETSAKMDEPCQIIYTSSTVQWGGNINFDELETSKVYSAAKCYADSKLCLAIHAKTLEKWLRQQNINVHAYAVHPGMIPTDLWDDVGFIIRGLRPLLKYFFWTVDDAACAVLYPALTPGIGEKWGGEYFEYGKMTLPNKQVGLPGIQKKLWERSLDLTQDFK
ncbi:Short-chain dehydrogenase TIC 32, chloroplastic [Orchesella cincta]|uniref:Short-chain dehydrogenase TIC 32, chloroplastic n=1 Tax=Orchesella cincta TaxID=48709 RepID=A0A1D2MQA4_ORCCI|nr:Short-chain dehydrogenase TIC 32, chloroplastic [Orchesella cincta]